MESLLEAIEPTFGIQLSTLIAEVGFRQPEGLEWS